jgi:hypothetical protein
LNIIRFSNIAFSPYQAALALVFVHGDCLE